MEIGAIIKTVLLIIGGLVVLDHTPGINILGDQNADYKSLVKCEAKYEGLARKSKDLTRSCRVTLKELKTERREKKKLERKNKRLRKELETEKRDYQGCVDSLNNNSSDRGGGKRNRLRGGEDGGAEDKGWKRIFPWR